MEPDQKQPKTEKKNVYELVKAAEDERAGKKPGVAERGKKLIRLIVNYSAPILSIGVFIAILVWGTIPSAQRGIFDRISEIDQKQDQIADMDGQIAALEDLRASEDEIDSDLEIIEKIVPSKKTQVAKFISEIEQIASRNGLEKSEYTSGEIIEELEEEQEEEKETAAIINIPTTSGYSARFKNIEDFLNDLYKKDDFIILSELGMQGASAREYYASQMEEVGREVTIDTTLPYYLWTMKVVFEKYQFSKGFEDQLLENLVAIGSEPDEYTLNFIRDRYGD